MVETATFRWFAAKKRWVWLLRTSFFSVGSRSELWDETADRLVGGGELGHEVLGRLLVVAGDDIGAAEVAAVAPHSLSMVSSKI